MATLSFSNITSSSFDINIDGMYEGLEKTITIIANGETWWDYYTVSESVTSITFYPSSLESGTVYNVDVSIYYSTIGDTESISDSCMTLGSSGGGDTGYDPDISSTEIVVKGTSATTISVRLEGLDTDYPDVWEIQFFIYDSQSAWKNEDYLKMITSTRSGAYQYSSTVTFDGLTPDTRYWIDAKLLYNGTYSWIDYITEYTDTADDYVPSVDNVELEWLEDDTTDTSIAIQLTGLDVDYTGNWKAIFSLTDESMDNTVQTIEQIFSGGDNTSDVYNFYGNDGAPLSPDTNYKVICSLWYYSEVDGDYVLIWYNTDGLSVSTKESEPLFDEATVIATANVGGTSITVYVAGLDTNYGRSDRYIYWYTDSTYKGVSYLDSNIYQTDSFVINSLSPNTTYTVKAVIYYTNNGVTLSKSVTTTCKTLSSRPSEFVWDSNITKGQKFQITADEWCALLDNINAVRVYRGLPEIQIGSSEGYFTYPNKGDSILALYYNQALNGITGILGTGYNSNKVSSKQPITAAKLILLQDMINDIE